MLRGITDVDLSTTVLGEHVSMPICISPTALHKLAHPDGEIATAKGCAKSRTLMAHSLFSSSRAHDVADALGESPRWQHLYILSDNKEFTKRIIEQEERLGVEGFVITVDEPVTGRRRTFTRSAAFYDYLKSNNVLMHRIIEMEQQ